MKFSMIRFTLIIMLIIIIVLIGCRNQAMLNYRRVKADYVNGKIKRFVQNVGNQNGVYLCQDNKKTMYLFLNGYMVKQGDRSQYFSNVKIVPKGKILDISFIEAYAKDNNKKLDNRLLYRIRMHKMFEKIRIFRNGKETHFDSISL